MAPNSTAAKEAILELPFQMRKSSTPELNIPNTSWRLSVIDLGYNSLKMVSYEVRPDGSFRAYDQRGELTKIGEGLDKTGRLSKEGIERTIRVINLLNEINRMEKVDRVLAVATSAVREAKNGPQFVRMVESKTKLRFRVLTRQEEALYSYIGGARATRFPTVLLFDLGGGSLELTYAEDGKIKELLSLPLGALRLTEAYGMRDGGYAKRDYDKLKLKIDKLLPSRHGLKLDDETVLIGVGGTVRALARYDQWKNGYQLNKIHNYVIRRKSVMECHKTLRNLTTDKISRIDSFGKDRAESVTTGSLIIAMLMYRLDFGELIVSTHGLRDGVLVDYLKSPRSFQTGKIDIERANSFRDTSRIENSKTSLIRDLFRLGLLSKSEETILAEAVGTFMDLYLSTRPETLFYSIISLDSRLNHKEQMAEAIALVWAKSPKMARWYLEHYSPILNGIDRQSIYRMGAVVALVEILHRTGSKAVVGSRKKEIAIEVGSVMGMSFPHLLLKEAVEELESSIGRRVRIEIRDETNGSMK